MSTAVGNASYRIRVDGVLSPAQFMPFQVMGFTVHNLTADDVKIIDDRGNAYTVHSGGTQSFNPPDPITLWRAGTYDQVTGNLKVSSGYGTVEFFNYRIPLNNNPQSNLPGTVPVAIQSGSVTILGSPVVTLAAGQQVIVSSVTGTVTVAISPGSSVSIAGTPNVNIASTTGTIPVNISSTSGTIPINISSTTGSIPVSISGAPAVTISGTPGVTINNTGPITTIDANRVSTSSALNNSTVSITTTRQTAQIIIQPRLETLARGGMLSVLLADPSGNQYIVCTEDAYQLQGVSLMFFQCMPYIWNGALPSGSTIAVTFTGQMTVNTIY